MDKLAPLVAVFIAGLFLAVEGATNGWVTKSAGSLYVAMTASFALSDVILVLAAPFIHVRPQWVQVRSLPPYAWLGGLYVLMSVALAAWATPKLGAGPALVATLLAQTALGLALDHFGVLGLGRSPITLLKTAGGIVMLGGAILIALGEKRS